MPKAYGSASAGARQPPLASQLQRFFSSHAGKYSGRPLRIAHEGDHMLGTSLAGLPAFLVYFCVAASIVVAYLFIYTRITPHDEFGLIRENVPAAAVALGLSLLGFVLPVASAIAHSANIVECVVWSIIALVVQLIAYFVAQVVDPHLAKRIAAGELASAIWLGFVSVTFGVLSAASMTS